MTYVYIIEQFYVLIDDEKVMDITHYSRIKSSTE